MVQVSLADPASPDGQALLESLSAALQQITGSSGKASFDVSDVQGERACFAIAWSPSGKAVGCGAVRPLDPNIAELKRMFAAPGQRGVGSALLAFLERQAVEFGYNQLWLETRKVNQRAVSFYERHGYSEIPSFGRYAGRPEAICLGKPLVLHRNSRLTPPSRGLACGQPFTSNVGCPEFNTTDNLAHE